MGKTHGPFYLRSIERMGSKDTGFSERFKRARIGLKDTLAVIDMTLDDQLGEFAISWGNLRTCLPIRSSRGSMS
jgi:hypothetical protein